MRMKPLAEQMASRGRYGDDMLVHMNRHEVAGLASLSPTGRLTVNPDTGQPEAFLPFLAAMMGSWLGSAGLAGGLTAAGVSAAAAPAIGGAIGSGLATTAATGDLEQGLISGLTGYGMGAALGEIGSAGSEAATAASDAALTSGASDAAAEMAGRQAAESAANNFAGFDTSVEIDPTLIDPSAATQLPTVSTQLTPNDVGFAERNAMIGQGAMNNGVVSPLMDQAIPIAVGESGRASLETQQDYEDRLKEYNEQKERDMYGYYSGAREVVPSNSPYYGMSGGGAVPSAWHRRYQEGGETDPLNEGAIDPRTKTGLDMVNVGATQQSTIRGDTSVPAPAGYRPGFDPMWNYFPNSNPPASILGSGERAWTAEKGDTGADWLENIQGISSDDKAWFGELLNEESALLDKSYWSDADSSVIFENIQSGGLNAENKERLTRILQAGGVGVNPAAEGEGTDIALNNAFILQQANDYRARVGKPPIESLSEIGQARGGIIGYSHGGRVQHYADGGSTINDLYSEILGRDVGDAGLGFYGPQMESGQIDEAQLRDILMASPERQHYMDASNPQVDQAYQDVLGRTAGREGEEFYAGKTYEEIVAAIQGEGQGDFDVNSEYERLQQTGTPQAPTFGAEGEYPTHTESGLDLGLGAGNFVNPHTLDPEVTTPDMTTQAQQYFQDIAVPETPPWQQNVPPTQGPPPDPYTTRPPAPDSPVYQPINAPAGWDPFRAANYSSPGQAGLYAAPSQGLLQSVGWNSYDPYYGGSAQAPPPQQPPPAQTQQQPPPQQPPPEPPPADMTLEPGPAADAGPPAPELGSDIHQGAGVFQGQTRDQIADSLIQSGFFDSPEGAGQQTGNAQVAATQAAYPDVDWTNMNFTGMNFAEGGPVAPMVPGVDEADMQALIGALMMPDENSKTVIDGFIEKYGSEIFAEVRKLIMGGDDVTSEGLIPGSGGGMADNIPGMAGANQPIAASSGEYIVPADVVSGLGDGNTDAGTATLDQMMDKVRQQRTGSTQQPAPLNMGGVMP